MNIKYKDFIGTFPNVYPEGYCQHLISEFKKNKKYGAKTRQEENGISKHYKEDSFMSLSLMSGFENFKNNLFDIIFFEGLQKCFDLYSEQFSYLKDVKLSCNNIKIQEISSGNGYHVWHSEQANGPWDSRRAVVYMLYLNTLPEDANGETEFLYQQRRIRPVENTMVLWPAGYTHMHRGNPVYGDNTKYIATGWFLLD